jgi:threonine dehydrogenase-like Zn-dependent dehydrogenase
MKTTTDVLIAGAGPVGLLLAAELSRDGVDVLLIERLITRSFFCKALGITPRTLEIFDDIGIAQDAIDSGVWLQGLSAFNAGIPGPSMDVPTDLPFGSLSLAQFDTERLLEACLHRGGGSVSYVGAAAAGRAPPAAVALSHAHRLRSECRRRQRPDSGAGWRDANGRLPLAGKL